MRGPGGEGDARAVLWFTLERMLRLLHPILPHLTETLWQALPGAKEAAGVEFLMEAAFPENLSYRDEAAEAEWEVLQEATTVTRNLQSETGKRKTNIIKYFVVKSSSDTVIVKNIRMLASFTKTETKDWYFREFKDKDELYRELRTAMNEDSLSDTGYLGENFANREFSYRVLQ